MTPGGACTLCEVGTYRTSGVHSLCTSCPVGNTTLTTGSKVKDDCSISKSLILNKSLSKFSVKVLVGRLWCFIGGVNRRKPQTCCKSLTNFIAVSSTPRHERVLNLQLEFICQTTISCYNVNIYKVRPNGFIGFPIVHMRFTEPFPNFVPNTYKLYNLRQLH